MEESRSVCSQEVYDLIFVVRPLLFVLFFLFVCFKMPIHNKNNFSFQLFLLKKRFFFKNKREQHRGTFFSENWRLDMMSCDSGSVYSHI